MDENKEEPSPQPESTEDHVDAPVESEPQAEPSPVEEVSAEEPLPASEESVEAKEAESAPAAERFVFVIPFSPLLF
jgi:hypothetical protein